MSTPAPVVSTVPALRVTSPLWPDRTCRTAWMVSALVVSGSGAVVGLLAMSLSQVLGAGVAIGALTAIAQQMIPRRQLLTRSTRLRSTVLVALVGTGGCVSLVGLLLFLGPRGLLVVALMAAASPPVLARGRIVLQAGLCLLSAAGVLADLGTAEPEPSDTEALPAASLRVETLSDAQLCQAWRQSYLALQRSQDPTLRAGLVQRRQDYLDELERRNPSGFARWLYRGARPASDPHPLPVRP